MREKIGINATIKSKIHKWEYGDLGEGYGDGYYPVDGVFYDEPEHDFDAENEEWERVLEETKDLPDIPL